MAWLASIYILCCMYMYMYLYILASKFWFAWLTYFYDCCISSWRFHAINLNSYLFQKLKFNNGATFCLCVHVGYF